MTPKKKDSPELFEVFRSAVRDRERTDDPEAVSEAERQALTAEAEEPAAPSRAEAPAPQFIPRPAPSRVEAPESGMGERRLTLKYNSIVLSLMLCVGLVFVAFAMGVRWGEDRGKQPTPRVAQENGLRNQLQPLANEPPAPGVPLAGASNQAYDPPPQPQVQQPPAETQAPPPQPVGKYWIRLIHFDAANSDAEALVRMHLKNLAAKGYDQACERRLQDSHGAKFLAVCYGPFLTKAQAEEFLPKLQGAERHHEYKQADVICDE